MGVSLAAWYRGLAVMAKLGINPLGPKSRESDLLCSGAINPAGLKLDQS